MSVAAVRLAGAAVLVILGTGCASVFGSYDIAPGGLPSGEDRLRVLLGSGQAATALQRVEQDPPADEVLHVLYEGVLAYHAGDYVRSAQLLDIAGYAADDRITKSISRSALSIVSNDLVLPYEPGRTERLMVPYYAALARTRSADREGAAVEARRLVLLLQQYRDSDRAADPSLASTLYVIAAGMFEANGNHDEADVAYRNALALDSTIAQGTGADAIGGTRLASNTTTLPQPNGVLYVIAEDGFVAHRVEQALAVMLLPEEVHAIAHGATDDRAEASALVAARILEFAALGPVSPVAGSRRARGAPLGGTLFVPAPEHSPLTARRRRTECRTVTEPATGQGQQPVTRQECTERDDEIDELPYLLKIAWPVFTEERVRAGSVRLVTGTDTASALAASVSRGVRADFDDERALIIARTLARGTAKLALTKGAERKLEEKNEIAGRLVGLLGNVGNVLLERADVRSWHLLPATISVTRVELPAGTHELTLQIGGRSIDLEGVEVGAGTATIIPIRAW